MDLQSFGRITQSLITGQLKFAVEVLVQLGEVVAVSFNFCSQRGTYWNLIRLHAHGKHARIFNENRVFKGPKRFLVDEPRIVSRVPPPG